MAPGYAQAEVCDVESEDDALAGEPEVLEDDAEQEEDDADEPEALEVPADPDWTEKKIGKHIFFEDAAGKQIGQIHQVNGRKATCRLHDRCVCWVTKAADLDALEVDLKTWLRQVAGPDPVSVASHAWAAYDLKIRYGIKPRKPEFARP